MRSLLKRILSPDLIASVKAKFESFDKLCVNICAESRFLSSVYYCFFSRKFDREHVAVLQGRKRYWKQLSDPAASSVMLRRNIHRVEKGLIMQPRRDLFGLAFIEETVQRYIDSHSANTLADAEGKWAKDVLNQYFEAVKPGQSRVVDDAREQFIGLHSDVNANEQHAPYSRDSIIKTDVSFEQFKHLCVQRRSVRWFEDKPVPRAEIDKAISAATLAPSACNRQPFEFFLFDNPDEAKEIGAMPMGTAGFSHNFQCVIVVVGDLAAYPYERDRHVIYIDGSLASMQLMLALETLGLSSCVINWPDIEQYEAKMADKLKLTENKRPLMMISIGYAEQTGMIPFSQKKSVNELIKEVQL
ncbi:nitroreductase family protein [Shewanella eurypsychrophilus]|uniref:Nitroreductase family protein n=1 Tax=Shewanella eurypsychrophilus TaxID=2593656 RepID=A0ABX6V7P7_9GAMM|nr:MULTISPECIES: nitroreductase family protein [Shewanella]QFU23440.1 nitroreductase-like protein [Shewanella sp. YLB-09]QPG58668.1 nitroreductase family protein [Shewanella eurypsychrophilus]